MAGYGVLNLSPLTFDVRNTFQTASSFLPFSTSFCERTILFYKKNKQSDICLFFIKLFYLFPRIPSAYSLRKKTQIYY
jgi:hypothetical protein